MGYEAENKQKIVDYLRAGSKGGDMGAVGVEMEHFILDEDGDAVPYQEKHGRLDVRTILEQLSEFYPKVDRTPEGDIVGCSRPSAAITIEPAAQIELSMAPLTSLAQVEDEYEAFRYRLDKIVEPAEYTVDNHGYHPSAKALDLPLIPKDRYHYMNDYFAQLPGMHAERMMRTTTSLQVSLDFADEADAIRKTRIATLLGPIFAFLCDNCPVFEGEPEPGLLRRMRVWREVDPARCGVIPGLFEPDFSFEKYADWLLATPPIFITRDGAEPTGTKTAAEAYADAPMTDDDVYHLLSMFWPDVRIKRYVEIRQADSLPQGPALGYVALIKGLFYGPYGMDLLEGRLGVHDDGTYPYTEQSVEDAIAAIVADGADAVVYGHSVQSWMDFLFHAAPEGLGTEREYLEPLKDFIGI